MSDLNPAQKFFGALTALGRRIEVLHDDVGASLSDESRSRFGEVFASYSALIEAVEDPSLAIGRKVSDDELRQLMSNARKGFRAHAA